jgi:hypothetical protein
MFYNVTISRVLFHNGSLLHSKFNTLQLITVHNSSRNLAHVRQILELQRIRLLSSSFSTGSLAQLLITLRTHWVRPISSRSKLQLTSLEENHFSISLAYP